MSTSILGIGLSALNAAQAGLSSTSHNISNAGTPGFSRQSAVQSTVTPQLTGAGFIGQGVSVETVRRSYSEFLTAQLREAGTQSAHMTTLAGQLANIDNLLSDAATGLTPAMNEFYAGVNALAAQPGDTPARQQLLSGAQVLASRYRGLAGALDDLRAGVNSGMVTTVGQINGQAASIAQLNEQIRAASGSGHAPNDLLDQRDLLLRDLGGQLRINVVPLADGTLNVFMPSGQALVMGGEAFVIEARPDPADPRNQTVGVTTAAGFRPMRESDVSGGVLGGLLAFRNQTLDGAENALGRGAATLAAAINAQHMAGQDRNGALGAAFFSAGSGPQVLANSNNTGSAQLAAVITNVNALVTGDLRVQYDGASYSVTRLTGNAAQNSAQVFASLPQTVDGVTLSLASGAMASGDSFVVQPVRRAALNFTALISDPALVAAALPVRGTAAAANTGRAVLAVTGVVPPPGVNLTAPVSLTFTSAGMFDVTGTGTGNPTGVAFTAGGAISYNGWSAVFNGTPATGDVFTIGPNSGGTGDNGNLLALAGLASAKLLDGGSATVHDTYAQMITRIGVETHAARIDTKAQAAVLAQAEAAGQAVAGVNLDEEAAALLKYQQAYQAAGKVIATANTLFQEILSIMR